MQEIKTTEEYQKEVEITEEEIESYSGCSERTQRFLEERDVYDYFRGKSNL